MLIKKKTIMLLGGSINQLPVVKCAHDRGCRVVCCDMNPMSYARNYVDAFYPVSTTDYEQLVGIAHKEAIDGVLTYASDPSAPGVAYVGNQLSLPSNPFDSVSILCRKDLFREFLAVNQLSSIDRGVFDCVENAFEKVNTFSFPVIVKPVDSSGSRGVTKVNEMKDLKRAFSYAMNFSKVKKVSVEGFVSRRNYQVAGDGFMVDGLITFKCFANEHFDKNGSEFVPIGESFPSIFTKNEQSCAQRYIQKILTLLGMRVGALNFDFCFTNDGNIFVIEIGPRNGGNLIPEIIRFHTGVDLVDCTVAAALGENCKGMLTGEPNGFFSSYMIHSNIEGVLKGIELKDQIKKNVIEERIHIRKGDFVEAFDGANKAIGSLVLEFDSLDEMLDKMDNMENYLSVHLKDKI